MPTKNKVDALANLNANIYDNTDGEITPEKNKIPFQDLLNSVPFAITVAQLQQENGAAVDSAAHILDAGRQGTFWYDSTDITNNDDGGGLCIVTLNNKRYKRVITGKVSAKWFGSANNYFASVAAANTAITAYGRFQGMELDILSGGTVTTFWYRDGVGDGNLIVKTSDSFPLDFTVGDGKPLTPADGTTTYTNNPLLLGRTILGFWVNGLKVSVVVYPSSRSIDTLYGQFNPGTAQLILVNGTFNQDSDYSIIAK